MKRTLLFIAGALLVTTSMNAQIILNQSSYPVSVLGTDSLEVTAAASFFPSFAAATNGSWDLSTITDSALTYICRINPDNPAYEYTDSSSFGFAGASFQGNVQSTISSTGLNQYEVFIPTATQALGPATVNVPAQNYVFSAPYTVIEFPATMGSNWSSSYQSVFNLTVTYSPILSNSPLQVISTNTEMDSVIGWGEMRVKGIGGSPSVWFQVLQVKTINVVKDSFAGAAAGILIGAGYLTQDMVTTSYSQNYYRTNEVTPFAKVTFTSGNYDTASQATTHTQRLLDNAVTNVVNDANVNVYPNPVSNHSVSIDVPAVAGEWSYELVNVLGQKVAASALPLSSNQTHTQIQLPNTIITGMYYIRLINNDKQVVVKPLEIN